MSVELAGRFPFAFRPQPETAGSVKPAECVHLSRGYAEGYERRLEAPLHKFTLVSEKFESLGEHELVPPRLSGQRQFVQFSAGFAPGRVVFRKNLEEALVMGRLNEVNHFVNDDVFKQVPWILH